MDCTEVKRVADDSPNRCQRIMHRGGQCNLEAMPGTQYCRSHGGAIQTNAIAAASLRNYRLTKWQAQLERHSTATGIKSLRDEIGLLRMLIEERLNRIEDSVDLVIQSGPLSDLILKVEKLVTSCHKIEGSMGQLLDKNEIIQFASELIGVISTELAGEEEKMQRIADKILAMVQRESPEEDPNATPTFDSP